MTEIEAVLEALHRLRDRIADNIVGEGAYASGRTTESMDVEQTSMGGRLLGRAYFYTLESGATPRAWPGPDTIRQWMIDKGIMTASDPDLDKAARAVNWSIWRHGTRLYQDGGRDTIYTTAIDETLEELQREVADIAVRRIADGITENNTKI